MGNPWGIHRGIMGIPMEVQGKPLGCHLGGCCLDRVWLGNPWELHGKSMGNQWEIHGKSMGNPLEIHGKPMGNPWELHGGSMGIHGESMGIHGHSMGSPWTVHVTSLGHPMGHPWGTHGNTWGIHGYPLVHHNTSTIQSFFKSGTHEEYLSNDIVTGLPLVVYNPHTCTHGALLHHINTSNTENKHKITIVTAKPNHKSTIEN